MIGLVLGATMALLPAHPLGNFSVNQLVSLDLHPDRVEAVAVVDLAELPALQLQPACADIARDISVTVAGDRLHWTVREAQQERLPGAAGLQTARVACRLTAPAALDRPATVDIANRYLPERLGWHELTAAGHGVRVDGLPSASVTNGLRSYPDDLLTSPPDVRSAQLRVQPGASGESAAANPVGTAAPGFLGSAETWLQQTVGDRALTPLVGLLAVLLAMVLGAGHAALPGHGKTVMAIYLAGRAGRPRDALFVGATVTATHTGGVLALGLLLTGASSLAGESVLGWLGIASGILVITVGAAMLRTALRNHRSGHHDGHHHHGNHHHGSQSHHSHSHSSHLHGHGHHSHHHASRTGDAEPLQHSAHSGGHQRLGHGRDGRGLGHHGAQGEPRRRGRRLSLAALGVAGGLVPSPSALIVLLGAIALGRTGFGVMLVLAYGLGMAATLTVAGLTLLKVRDRLRGRFTMLARLAPAAPYATGGLVLMVGVGLAARAAALVA